MSLPMIEQRSPALEAKQSGSTYDYRGGSCSTGKCCGQPGKRYKKGAWFDAPFCPAKNEMSPTPLILEISGALAFG
jgi:hypothetical protein